MNDAWANRSKPWLEAAVGRRFRHYVRTGRIIRPRVCCYCGAMTEQEDGGGSAEFHHISYEKWWVGSWLCTSCHRKADHGGIKLDPVRHVWDYYSVIAPLLRGPLQQVTYERAPF